MEGCVAAAQLSAGSGAVGHISGPGNTGEVSASPTHSGYASGNIVQSDLENCSGGSGSDPYRQDSFRATSPMGSSSVPTAAVTILVVSICSDRTRPPRAPAALGWARPAPGSRALSYVILHGLHLNPLHLPLSPFPHLKWKVAELLRFSSVQTVWPTNQCDSHKQYGVFGFDLRPSQISGDTSKGNPYK